MNKFDYRGRGYREKRRRRLFHTFCVVMICLMILILGVCGVIFAQHFIKGASKPPSSFRTSQHAAPGNSSEAGGEEGLTGAGSSDSADGASPGTDSSDGADGASSGSASAATADAALEALLVQADRLAAGYDYDAAIALLKEDASYGAHPRALEKTAEYEDTKSKLVRVNPQEITHVFFHSLIIDTSKAFDGDSQQDGYNQMMTTKDEFLKMMQSMYDRGYVLVRIRDVAHETVDENGDKKFAYGDIMLPEGKKAFVLSQDDVCYYEYMKGDGFADRMIVGEDGYPTCEMTLDDGTVSVGDYDLVPILERFIQEHPGFSYKGARGILAFTGYNGILGYRTDAAYSDSPTYESDRREAAKVAQCLRDRGWELASHSWGHRDMGTISMEHFKTDTDKWEANVESLIGPTDIILYPFGSDIGTWKPYTEDNERFAYLKSKGFRYFCNVDASNKYWMQLGPGHFRQGRRDLDGYRMYYYPESMEDLFNTSEVFDASRPTPVPQM